MPAIRPSLALKTLPGGVRAFATSAARPSAADQLIYRSRFITHHYPSQRILAKAAANPHHHASRFPLMVRDATSYGALGAVAAVAAFTLYSWDRDADLTDYFSV